MDSSSNEYAFIKVVELASFVRAADVMGITASAVSKKVDKLERRLGTRLLRRSTRSISLTPSGEVYFNRMRAVFDEVRNIETAASSANTMPAGVVRISCYAAFCTHVFLPLLAELFDMYPNLKVELVPGDRLDIAAAAVDIQITSIVPAEKKKNSFKIQDNPHLICASPNYLARAGKLEKPSDLSNHNCLILNGRSTCDDEWLFKDRNAASESVLVQAVSGNFGGFGLSVYHATLNGLGIARLPLFMVRQNLENGSLVEVLAEYAPDFGRAIYAIIPDGHQAFAKQHAVISFLQQRLQKQSSLFDLNQLT